MNRVRVILAGIVGGIFMFVGGFLTHGVLQIDNMFMKDLPSEAPVVSSIQDTISQRGWYVFPAREKLMATEEGQKELKEKWSKGPTGIVIYNPKGGQDEVTLMSIEALSNVALCIILAAVLMRVAGSKPTRIALATLLGVAAWLAIDVSYWNWDKFPDTYVLAGLIDQGVSWFLAGTAITLVLGKHAIAAPVGAKA